MAASSRAAQQDCTLLSQYSSSTNSTMTSESLHSDSDSLEQAEMLAVLGTAPSKAAVTPQASEAHTNSGSAPDYADRHHEIHINSDQITLYEHHMANFRRMDSNDAYMQDKYILYDLSALQSHDSRDRLDSSLSRIALRANYWDTKHQQVLDSHRHYIPVMLALSTDRLPKELVLRILAVRASSMLSELVIDKKKTLYKAAENLLGREAPNELVQIMENTILEVVPIRLVDVNFIRKDTAATMVDFLHSSISTSQMSSLRSLVLTIDVACNGQYPAQLFRLTASMASLKEQSLNLRLFQILLQLTWRPSNLQDLSRRNAALDTRRPSRMVWLSRGL
ncbi:hypothetical protein LTR42_011327 [Elasticomyces elasticus]|nr:hypothetical protein LTR42_011327 [Elasticomyces elasticus]